MAPRKVGSSTSKTHTPDAAKSRQIRQLRATVHEFRMRLQQEARQKRLDLHLLAEAGRTRTRIGHGMTTLREQGRKLASQLRKALRESKRQERTRRRTQARVAELRAVLTRKTEELRRNLSAAKAKAASVEVAPTVADDLTSAVSATLKSTFSAKETAPWTDRRYQNPTGKRPPKT